MVAVLRVAAGGSGGLSTLLHAGVSTADAGPHATEWRDAGASDPPRATTRTPHPPDAERTGDVSRGQAMRADFGLLCRRTSVTVLDQDIGDSPIGCWW